MTCDPACIRGLQRNRTHRVEILYIKHLYMCMFIQTSMHTNCLCLYIQETMRNWLTQAEKSPSAIGQLGPPEAGGVSSRPEVAAPGPGRAGVSPGVPGCETDLPAQPSCSVRISSESGEAPPALGKLGRFTQFTDADVTHSETSSQMDSEFC